MTTPSPVFGAVVASLMLSHPAAPQRPAPIQQSNQSIAWTQPVSPSVVGIFIVRNGEPTVLLLRGRPGWFTGGGRQGGSGGGSGDGSLHRSETFGETKVDYRLSGSTADVQGVSVDLTGGKNVLLIDRIDAQGSQLSVSAIAVVLPPLTGPATPLAPAFETMPEAVAFLRCGETLPDEQLKVWNRFVCDQIK